MPWGLIAALVGLGAGWGPPRAVAGSEGPNGPGDVQARAVPVDRWLVSDPFASDAATAEAALADDPLGAETARELFPDRDVEMGGTYWHLVRDDSSATLDLDRVFPERPGLAVTYAHAYLRSPYDRTVRLRWRPPACGAASLRLNALPLAPARSGQEAGEPGAPGAPRAGIPEAREPDAPAAPRRGDESAMVVRLAAGWNTLLAAVAAGDCPYRLEVRLEPARSVVGGDEEGQENEGRADALQGLSVQASRPPGVLRTYPRPYVTAALPSLAGPLRWPAGDADLTGDLALELASWGAPAELVAARRAQEQDREEREAREGRQRPPPARRPPRPPEAPPGGPPPGEAPAPESERERLAELRARLLPPPPPPLPGPERVEIRLEAGGREVRRTVGLDRPGAARAATFALPVRNLDRAARSGGVEVRLRWTVEGKERRLEGELPLAPGAAERALREAIELSGWSEAEEGARRGEWRIPEALSGLAIELLTRGAPGLYALDGKRLEADAAGRIPLCDPCRKGARLRLQVVPTGEWSATPAVRVSAPAGG